MHKMQNTQYTTDSLLYSSPKNNNLSLVLHPILRTVTSYNRLGMETTALYCTGLQRHVVERCWVSPLLLLLPALFSLLLVLPAPLLPETHALAALPDPAPALCTTPGDPSTFQNAVAILGFLLPSAVIICLVIGLAFRRCFRQQALARFCNDKLVFVIISASLNDDDMV